MRNQITITLTDEIYELLKAAAEANDVSSSTLAADMVRLGMASMVRACLETDPDTLLH